ncbi:MULTISPECIES: hypothetical protein [Pantoea]|uniref:Uncharacterized protein n=1 Tax=Candidatus Pantoea gossypiicola TaxID=2608008 RepID=A0AB34CRU9_9GAMM|nr:MULTISPECIES: hypothetical protein [Pantoea]KAA5933696.1 hypothetical protein F3I59_01405 [Pantoea sp. VH_8]KAA5938237.1 hypothetical protein F3I58_00190 [Pantoea sp. VH_4]KAA5990165.1 hypothetical protein F3I49_00180 [Pantoea sp. M_4]KAA6129044.1 hypothetical protein F3I20_01720 [Pantoea gossypiicola]
MEIKEFLDIGNLSLLVSQKSFDKIFDAEAIRLLPVNTLSKKSVACLSYYLEDSEYNPFQFLPELNEDNRNYIYETILSVIKCNKLLKKLSRKITQNEINIALKKTEKGEDYVLLCGLSIKRSMLNHYVDTMPDLLPDEDSFMTDDIDLLKLSTEDITKILLCDMLERGALIIHMGDELRSKVKVIKEKYWNEVESIYNGRTTIQITI